jgi:hypothetical protein
VLRSKSSSILVVYTEMIISKRVGLHKAIHQIEDAIRKSRADTGASGKAEIIQQLQYLLQEAQDESQPTNACRITQAPYSSSGSADAHHDDQLSLDDAENPLQLLARASDLRLGQPQTFHRDFASSHTHDRGIGGFRTSVNPFFHPMKVNPDVGSQLDPIDLGLVTMEEAELLMQQ